MKAEFPTAAIFISFFVLDDLLLFKDKHFYAI